ncbi:MAG: cobalamin-binding protein [Gemmatimonadetes bacterium]|nr:cobalamin-binding protein [Gemmatimonadota bacterium]
MASAPIRIASMLASATEIVAALGLESRLVAISHECDHPPEVLDRPRVSQPRFEPDGMDSGAIDRAVRQAVLEHGSVYAVDGERLARLQPTLVLTQAVCEVCAVPTAGVREVIAEHGINAAVLSLDAHTLDDIFASIEQVGHAAGAVTEAHALAARLRDRVQRVRDAVLDRPRPRVLAIEWLDPPFTPGHWVPEMIDAAGGHNLAGTAGDRSRETSWDALAELDPDVLLIMPCGFGLDASLRDADAHAGPLRRVAPRAIREGRAFAVDGSALFNRSGPRVVDGIELLGALLHPECFGHTAAERAAVWGGHGRGRAYGPVPG